MCVCVCERGTCVHDGYTCVFCFRIVKRYRDVSDFVLTDDTAKQSSVKSDILAPISLYFSVCRVSSS